MLGLFTALSDMDLSWILYINKDDVFTCMDWYQNSRRKMVSLSWMMKKEVVHWAGRVN